MDIGMMWFDNDPKSEFLAKVKKAAEYYRQKYGSEPNLCFVHPSMLESTDLIGDSLKICANSSVLPHHFWIGVQQKQTVQP